MANLLKPELTISIEDALGKKGNKYNCIYVIKDISQIIYVGFADRSSVGSRIANHIADYHNKKADNKGAAFKLSAHLLASAP